MSYKPIQEFPDELDWVNAQLAAKCGSFLEHFCKAALAADGFNYQAMRAGVLILKNKYPADEFRLLMERHDNGRSRPGDAERIRELWNQRGMDGPEVLK
jgi:hypothetical protein